MKTINLDKNIPLPPRTGGGGKKGGVANALRTMQVGDSFVMPPGKQKDMDKVQRYALSASSQPELRDKGMKFATRKLVEDGNLVIRIWRTA